ncbi:MAG TPA: hypothetical protein VMZ31_00670 [Phycisphaerae bacterium]|nr:hypothetical protein [Phycisphaerae bacterium]
MDTARGAIGFALSVTTWACLVGCQSVGGDLDCVAESIEKWGTVSISGATLIKPDPRFGLDLHLTGNQIFERNRIEGFSRILQKDAFEAQISVRAEIIANLLNQVQATEDPKLLGELKKGLMAAAFEGLLGALPDEERAMFQRAFASLGQRLGGGVQPSGSDYGDSAYQAGVAATGGAGPAPTPPKPLTTKPTDQSRRLALGAVDKALSEGLESYEGPLTLNLQQLLTLTASDKNMLEMLRWLSYPRGYAPGKRVFLCMATVNIVPGRQTYRGYYGQVDLYMEYGKTEYSKKEARHPTRRAGKADGTVASSPAIGGRVKRVTARHPICFAVYPLIDAQVLDLRTSRRQLFTTAIQLAVSGYHAAANVLLDHARKREQDVETITGINAVTSYSTGSHLGFTFAPRLSAQADPANINTGPQMALQPQTFPVMIMVICDEESIRDRHYDHLIMYQTARWRRAPDPSSDARWLIGRPLSELAFPRMSEHEIIKRAEALDRVYGSLLQYRKKLWEECVKEEEKEKRVKKKKEKGPQPKCKHRDDEGKSKCEAPSDYAFSTTTLDPSAWDTDRFSGSRPKKRSEGALRRCRGVGHLLLAWPTLLSGGNTLHDKVLQRNRGPF